jgi:hypothetical protein
MCICTHYDGQCGHTWISNSQPCGPFRDLLNCPNHQIAQYLIAPPGTCPTCCGGFADPETIQMVQGPWGCNQMLRNQCGGELAIPGAWGNAPLLPQHWAGNTMMAVDHRLTGPMVGPVVGMGMHDMAMGMPVGMPMIGSVGMPAEMPMGMPITGPHVIDQRMISDNYYDNRYGMSGYGSGFGYNSGRSRRRRSSHHYREFRHKQQSGPQCSVM